MNELELYHYGVKRKSGRYPWGSGKDPYQGEVNKKSFLQKRKEKQEERYERKAHKIYDRYQNTQQRRKEKGKKYESFANTKEGQEQVKKKWDDTRDILTSNIQMRAALGSGMAFISSGPILGSLYAATNIVLADRYRRDYERLYEKVKEIHLEDVKKQSKPVH